ncbi:PF20097 family protein [Wukongibacter sp. M2B1]|uniref:PF20097 family protein n=1 Tax=Wukongibacter sp. M2B1 TaxID=3088895 RepID=UPI003D799B57
MKCPYCNKDMEFGKLESCRDDIAWFSSEKRVNGFVKFLGFGGDVISFKRGVRPVISGYRCYNCSKIIIEVKEDEE